MLALLVAAASGAPAGARPANLSFAGAPVVEGRTVAPPPANTTPVTSFLEVQREERRRAFLSPTLVGDPTHVDPDERKGIECMSAHPDSFATSGPSRVGMVYERIPTAVHEHSEAALSRLLLEDWGFKVIRQAWGTGRNWNPWFKGFSIKLFGASLYRSQRAKDMVNSRSTMIAAGRNDIWPGLSSSIAAKAPSCWRRLGYYGPCEDAATERGCELRANCQWMPNMGVKLLEDLPHPSDTDVAREAMTKY